MKDLLVVASCSSGKHAHVNKRQIIFGAIGSVLRNGSQGKRAVRSLDI